MAPTPEIKGLPGWVGPLMLAGAASVISWVLGMTTSVVTKIDAQTVQLAKTEKVLEMLCTFMEEKKQLDRTQDEQIRQIQLQMRTLGR